MKASTSSMEGFRMEVEVRGSFHGSTWKPSVLLGESGNIHRFPLSEASTTRFGGSFSIVSYTPRDFHVHELPELVFQTSIKYLTDFRYFHQLPSTPIDFRDLLKLPVASNDLCPPPLRSSMGFVRGLPLALTSPFSYHPRKLVEASLK